MGRDGERKGRSIDDWTCKQCCNKAGKPWRNKGDSKACSHCNVAKGSCFGAKVVRGGDNPSVRTLARSRAGVPTTTKEADCAKSLLSEERRKRVDEGSAKDKKLAAKDKKIADLEAKLAASGAMDVEENLDGRPDAEAAALKAAVDEALADLDKLKKFEEINPDVRMDFADYDEKVLRAPQAVDKAKANKRKAHPLKQRLEESKACKARRVAALEAAREAADELQEELKKLEADIIVQAAAVDSAEVALADVEKELAELASQVSDEKPTAFLVAPGDDLALQEAVAKAVAASWAKWEQAAFRLREVAAAACAERDQILAGALARFQKDQDEADAEDDASLVDTDSEPAAKRQKEKDKKAAVVAKRRDIKRRFDEDVQKAHLKVKK